MTTIEVWHSFRWATLTLIWYARRPDTAIAPSTAIDNAATSLEREGAVVRVSPARDAVQFGYPWIPFTGRLMLRRGLPWFFWVLGGQLSIETSDGRTAARAQGSLVLLFLVPLALCVITYLKFRQATIVVAALLLIYVAFASLVCSNALQTLTMTAVAPLPRSRAA